MKPMSWTKSDHLISTDPGLLDLKRVHEFLSSSYWARGIPLGLVQKSISHSLNFGIYRTGGAQREQVGFARVISDFTTFAYLCDVFIAEHERGKGLGTWLMECVMSHPELQGLRRFCLGTRDAHSIYAGFGFEIIRQPENWMEIRNPDPYLSKARSP